MRTLRRFLLTAMVLVAARGAASGQTASPSLSSTPAPAPAPVADGARPQLRAVRALGKVVIDGKLDDTAWLAAASSNTFVQHFPDEGAAPSEPTTVRVVYDDEAIYVGIDCTQLRAPIVRRLMRRDRDLPSDGVWIDLDSRNDGVSAFHFGVNAAGVLNDGVHFNDVDYSRDWDGNWQAKVAMTEHGYSVEIRIPLGDLRFDTRSVQEWGFQVRRFIDARQETDDWAFFPRSAAGVVSRFGRLTGLTDLRPGHRFEVRPFALARLRHRDDATAATPTLAHGTDQHLSAGIDSKAHLTPELTLDLSVLPDFGQIEADTLILNLSTYETFFPEKRPFFLEGVDTFSTMRTMLYTRRIGRQPATPALHPRAGTTEILVDVPDPSSIWGAAKLIGRIGRRTTVALLAAVTGQNQVDVRVDDMPGVTTQRRLADPLTTFNVLRLQHITGATSDAGLLFTATNRFERPGAVCPATGDAVVGAGRCFNDAYTGSADARWRSAEGDYMVAAQAVGSLLERGGERTQPDGHAVVPGHPAGGATLWTTKQGGAHWLWSLGQHLTGRQLELNDVGYLDRKNDYIASFDLSYRTIEPWRGTVETRTTLQLRYRESLDGLNLYNAVELNTTWTAANFWSFYFEVHARGARFDDRETGDGAALERAGLLGVEGSVSSDPRRRVVGWMFGQAHRMTNGYHFEARGQITLRLRPQLDVDLLPSLVYQSGEPRYVSGPTLDATGAPTYTFAAQLARNVGATLRASYTFTPELTLQAYAQLFLLAEHFSDFSTFTGVAGQRSQIHLSDLPRAPPPASSNPDVLQTTLNVNVVLRWEYRLGSTVYLVYTRAQTPLATFLPGEEATLDVRPILHGRAAIDVLMFKLSYWFG